MNSIKERAERKIDAVVNSPILSTNSKIAELKRIREKALTRMNSNQSTDDLATMFTNHEKESSNTFDYSHKKVYQKINDNIGKAGVTNYAMLIMIMVMLMTGIILIGIIIGSIL